MDHYFAILELRPGASENEIKKAYRKLARRYHPDVSKEPDAEERFLEITEAYDYLLERRTRPAISYSRPFETVTPEPTREEQRRQRARAFAQMRYEEFRQSTLAFKRSWYFTPLRIITWTAIVLCYALFLLMILSPLLAWIHTGETAIIIGFCLIAMVSPHMYQIAKSLQTETRHYFEDWEN